MFDESWPKSAGWLYFYCSSPHPPANIAWTSVALLCSNRYSRLFSWLVNAANTLVNSGVAAPKRGTHSIGVLDIFGFENLYYNGIEQLCINVANERLHQFFNNHLFAWQKTELEAEGLKNMDISFETNDALLEVVEGSPLGLLSLLDEETKFPGATDQTLIYKLRSNLQVHEQYTPSTDQNSLKFTLNHYAGTVAYDTAGWLEKNTDTLSPACTSIFRSSVLPLVAELFTLSQTTTGNLAQGESPVKHRQRQSNAKDLITVLRGSVWKGQAGKNKKKATKKGKNLRRVESLPQLGLGTQKNTRATLCYHFRNSLNDLMMKLRATMPQFVRCIRPNETLRPQEFNAEVVVDQLRYTGVLETVRVRRDGYAVRMPFADFISKYKLLAFRLMENVPANGQSCGKIIMNCDIPTNSWAIGRSKVLLKYTALNTLLAHLGKISVDGNRVVLLFRVFLAKRTVDKRRREAAVRAEEERLRIELEKQRAVEERRQRDHARLVRANEERDEQASKPQISTSLLLFQNWCQKS